MLENKDGKICNHDNRFEKQKTVLIQMDKPQNTIENNGRINMEIKECIEKVGKILNSLHFTLEVARKVMAPTII